MGSMAAVAPFLDRMATFTKSSPNFLRNTKVLSLDTHAIKADRMPALMELLQLFFVAFSAFIGENHSLLLRSCLVVNVAGHTMDPIFCMFGLDP